MKKIVLSFIFLFSLITANAQNWVYESTANGKIPKPWGTTQQTAAMTVDIDNDGVEEWVLGCRVEAPALIYYRKTSLGWEQYVIDNSFLTIEAGGTFYDIDGDGDKDLVFGGDWQSNKVWWWENPYPFYNPNVPWKRYEIKNDGQTHHHDQVFGDFKQTGKAQLAFWNQGAKTLFLADIPERPTEAKNWHYETLFSGEAGEKSSWYAEGCTAADVDGDGNIDLIAGNYWFKYKNGVFNPIRIGEAGGRVVAAKFKPGKTMQIVISPGDGKGRLMLYECLGDPEIQDNWKGKDLIGRELIHSHTLEAADINDDGNMDLFVAEMAKWSEKQANPDNPAAEAIILYGDGKGNFTKKLFKKGGDFHEAKIADIDGDGDLDILSKPYNWKAPRLDVWLQNGSEKKLPPIGKTMEKRIGLELYSLRDYFKIDVPGTLKYIKDLGITELEGGNLYGLTPKEFNEDLATFGLKMYSALFDLTELKDSTNKFINLCKALKVEYAGAAWIPHKGNDFTRENADFAIKTFNEVGEKMAKAGIHFIYHAHGFEFQPSPEGTLFDYIVQKTNPKFVNFECDVYWAFHGGQDPALLLKKYKGRFAALHLKDMKYGQETGLYTGNTPLTSDVAIGTGQLNFTKIMRAAMQTGVKYYFIEDENAEVKQHLPITLRYLKNLK